MNAIWQTYSSYFKAVTKNVAIFYVIMLLGSVTSSAFGILLAIYMKNLGFTEEVVGGILSLMTLGVGLGAFPVTVLADRFNRKNTLIAGLVVMWVSGLVMVNSSALLAIQIAAFAFGAGQATAMILQMPILYENTPEEHRVTAFSFSFVLQTVSFIFSSFILGHASTWLAQRLGDASANVLVLNASNMVLLLGLFAAMTFSGQSMLKSGHSLTLASTLRDTLQGYRLVLRGTSLWYVLQVALIGFGAGMIVPFFSIYLKYTLDITDGAVGTIMAISQLGSILGGLIVAPMSKKLGRVKTVLICQLLSIPFLVSISVPQGLLMITISFFFRTSLMNMAGPIINSLSMDIVADEARTHMSSVVSMTSNLFRALGVFVGGYVMYAFSYNTPYFLTIVCYLIGTAVFYRQFKHLK